MFYPIPNGVLYTNIVENSIRENIIGTQRTFRNGVTHHYRRNDYMLVFPVAPYIMFLMIKSIIQRFKKQIQNGFGPEDLDLVFVLGGENGETKVCRRTATPIRDGLEITAVRFLFL